MRILTRLLLCCLIVLSLSGCEVKDRVVWSPDGSRAAVMCNDGLRIADVSGTLSEPLLDHVDLAAWMPDSEHLLVVTDKQVRTWSEVKDVAPPEYLVRIEKTARTVQEKLNSYDGNWEEFTNSISELPFLSEAAVYLKDNAGTLLADKLGSKWKDTENQVAVDVFTLRMHRLDQSFNCTAGPVIYKSIRRIVEARANLRGKTALLVEVPEPFEQACPYHLVAVNLDNGATKELSQGAARFPDWSADGNSAVFIEVADELKLSACQTMHMGYLRRTKICSPAGELLQAAEMPEELVKLLFRNESRVRCLKDGTIIFSSLDLNLPATPADIADKQVLFSINPATLPTTVRLIPKSRENLVGDAAQYFEVNSEGKLVSIPSDAGHVSVMNLSDGAVRNLDTHEFSASKGLRFAPKWRTAEEICLPAHPNKKGLGKHSAEIILWSLDSDAIKTISKNWPDKAVKDFLD